MRSLTLAGTVLLLGTLMSGCESESGAPADHTLGLAADAADHNVADHFRSVETVTFSDVVNPCNGEQITLTGTVTGQMTLVDTREHLDAGNWLHMEFQQQVRATGTGSETGATYTFSDIFHESFNSPNVSAPHLTVSAHGNGRVTTDVPGLSFTAHFVFHGVVPSGKDFKVTTELEKVTCS